MVEFSSCGLLTGAGGRSGNTLASDVSGLDSTARRSTLEFDTGYHPFGVGEMCCY